jgi:peptidyl-tRNA hydrolase, PTH1 family
MKIILAQGNPGADYTNTRHNVGFLAVAFYGTKHQLIFQNKSKFYAEIAEVTIGEQKILFAKPTTFYNETGRAARSLADFYKIPSTDILVIHDDLALPFGTLRTRQKGRDAGNNGIKSLNAHLGEQYHRIRVGIWNDLAERMSATDFVLGTFSTEEAQKLQSDILPKIAELIDDFIADQHTSTSHAI